LPASPGGDRIQPIPDRRSASPRGIDPGRMEKLTIVSCLPEGRCAVPVGGVHE
jgi:hypothetical protein